MTETGDLDLVEEFLNTLDRRTFSRNGEQHVPSDALDSVDALSGWLSAHDLSAHDRDGADLSAEDLATARALRAGLRTTLDASGPLPGFPLELAADGEGRLRLHACTGVPGLDVLVETVATNVATGRWARLKLCASDDCRWAFHDTSRSGGGRWCSMEVCGNRHKTRGYRERRTA